LEAADSLDGPAYVVEKQIIKNGMSINLIAFMNNSPVFIELTIHPTCLEAMLLDNSSVLTGPTESL